MSEDDKWYLGRRTPPPQHDDADEERLEAALLGASCFRLLQGIATREDIQAVMVRLFKDCERVVRENLSIILTTPLLDTPQARELHFNARVHAQLLTMVNAYVKEGAQAEAEINNEPN